MTGSKRDSRALPASGHGATVPARTVVASANSRDKCTQMLPESHRAQVSDSKTAQHQSKQPVPVWEPVTRLSIRTDDGGAEAGLVCRIHFFLF